MPKADKKKEVKNGKKKESKNDQKKDDVKGEEPEKEEKVSRPELVGTAALDAKKSSPEMRRRLLDPEEEECDTFVVDPDLPTEVQFAKLAKKKVRPPPMPVRPPMAIIVGVAGSGKSMLASAILGKRQYRAIFKPGTKTTKPNHFMAKGLAILDTPGLPDPFPASSDTYYDETVNKLREVGYANCLIFVVNSERITPTLIRNYGILYRAFNKLSCVKVFVLRRETSFTSLGIGDQDRIADDGKETVNKIMEASKLKKWRARQFFILTNGTGDEQDRQVKHIREQVRISPVVLIDDKHGLKLTSEVPKSGDESARDFQESLVQPPKWPGMMAAPLGDEEEEKKAKLLKKQEKAREQFEKDKKAWEKEKAAKAKQVEKMKKENAKKAAKEQKEREKIEAKEQKEREKVEAKEKKAKEKLDAKEAKAKGKLEKKKVTATKSTKPTVAAAAGSGDAADAPDAQDSAASGGGAVPAAGNPPDAAAGEAAAVEKADATAESKGKDGGCVIM